MRVVYLSKEGVSPFLSFEEGSEVCDELIIRLEGKGVQAAVFLQLQVREECEEG